LRARGRCAYVGQNKRALFEPSRVVVETKDAVSENVLWSDRFNLEVEELFDLQDEIAGAVAARLSVQIDFAERRQESPYPRDMRACGLWPAGSRATLNAQLYQGSKRARSSAFR
jgi:adenylate cyclase